MTEPTDTAKYGIQAAHTEKTRTPEFKESRGKIITEVNRWLKELAHKRDNGEPLSDGSIIGAQPRVIETDLGSTSVGAKMMGIDYLKGISLTGDGESTPLKLQSVKSQDDGVTEVITVLGTDPIAASVRGEEYPVGNSVETVASFGVTSLDQSDQEQYFTFNFRGDGSVRRSFVTAEGVHTSHSIVKAEDLELAQAGFEQIKTIVG